MSSFYEALGLTFRLNDDCSELTVGLPDSALADGPSGATHGGIVATLVDLAGTGIVAAAGNAGVTTISATTDYLAPAVTPLVARGQLVRLGRTIGVASVEVTHMNDLVAIGRTVVRIHRSVRLDEVEAAAGLDAPRSTG